MQRWHNCLTQQMTTHECPENWTLDPLLNLRTLPPQETELSSPLLPSQKPGSHSALFSPARPTTKTSPPPISSTSKMYYVSATLHLHSHVINISLFLAWMLQNLLPGYNQLSFPNMVAAILPMPQALLQWTVPLPSKMLTVFLHCLKAEEDCACFHQ